jgi:hypothetical protein
MENDRGAAHPARVNAWDSPRSATNLSAEEFKHEMGGRSPRDDFDHLQLDA